MSSPSNPKCFWAKYSGVEKCSGTKPILRGLSEDVIVNIALEGNVRKEVKCIN